MIEVLLEAERAMDVGLLDQAERLFRQAADADPRNSIAVVGLARVALERGNDDGALDLARRALEIDGENPAARRLVDRLVEVRAYREAADAAAGPGAGAPTGPAAPVDPAGAPAPPAPPSSPPVPAPGPRPSLPPEPRRGLLRRLLRR